MLPTFLRQLADPNIRTVLLCGCGGGFDFLHGLLLYPELKRLGKKIVIGSYSFGDPHNIGKPAPVVFNHEDAENVVKQVSAESEAPEHYAPEIHLCSYLDDQFPNEAPHHVYAYYARAFTVPELSRFYQRLIAEHDVDAVVLIDGGSDSLMIGDEEGLGDPIEDAVSVAAVAAVENVALKLLLSVGFGADRFNHVSDAASLRAVAELTAAGGFRGAISVEPGSPGAQFYQAGIAHIYEHQRFRSALTGFILAAIEGRFGNSPAPTLPARVKGGDFFIWPLMAMVWAFDVEAVAQRSLIVGWIKDETTIINCHKAFYAGRSSLEDLRPVEELPVHIEMRARR